MILDSSHGITGAVILVVGNLQLKRLTAGSGIAIVALHTKRATNGHGAVYVFNIAP